MTLKSAETQISVLPCHDSVCVWVPSVICFSFGVNINIFTSVICWKCFSLTSERLKAAQGCACVCTRSNNLWMELNVNWIYYQAWTDSCLSYRTWTHSRTEEMCVRVCYQQLVYLELIVSANEGVLMRFWTRLIWFLHHTQMCSDYRSKVTNQQLSGCTATGRCVMCSQWIKQQNLNLFRKFNSTCVFVCFICRVTF